MTRKILLILLTIILALALTGCGGDKEPAASNTQGNTAQGTTAKATKKPDEFNFVLNMGPYCPV